MLFACGLSFFLGVISTLWLFWRRGYQTGFKDGERFGRTDGYRLAWLKQHRSYCLNAQTEDFYDQ